MESIEQSASGLFDCNREEDSVFEGTSSIAANLEQKRAALRGEVSQLKKRVREIRKYLKTQGTCTSRNAETESKIRFVKDDIEALNASRSELETEIAACMTCIGDTWREATLKNETKKAQHEVDVEDKKEEAIAFYEKVLEFRLENEIFDEDFPTLQILEDRLRRCTEFVDEVKSLRERLCENSVMELDPVKEDEERRAALRSYSELMLQYYESQLKRTKLVLLRLQKAKKKINYSGAGDQA